MNAQLGMERYVPRDLVSHLRSLALGRPADTALIVVGGDVEAILTYADLDRRVRALAAELQSRFERGARVLLLLDNDEHYVVGFLGCLYAGLIAVPLFAPESAREQHLARLRAVALDCQPRGALVTRDVHRLLQPTNSLPDGTQLVEVDGRSPADATRWREYRPGDHDTAFLQYTSGSTSTPKGVMIGHGNLMANERAIEASMSIGPEDRFMSWLPLFHDMGLVGGLLQPLHRGIPVVLAAPRYFLEAPVRWLRAISRYRATISGGPDFAYRLCVERVTEAQRQELDLSSWRVAFCGAEPVRHDTLQAFADRFASVGFDAGALYPCYGLAEGTLLVTGGRRGAGVSATTFASESLAQGRAEPFERGTVLVGCGHPASDHVVEIVASGDGTRLPPDRIGEIWASGPSVAQGYWRRDADTSASFVERDGRRWLRTGDLGFLHAGNLHIAGRQKDLIVVRGQNVYPQDIEQAIESQVEAVRKGRVAAFSVPRSEGEGIGVAVEVSRGLQKLVAAQTLVDVMNSVVSSLCQEPLAVVVLLNPGALPKTSSGKLQRAACREGWQYRSLDAFAIHEQGRFVLGGPAPTEPTAAGDAIELELIDIWRAVLHREGLGAEARFFACGGNSLTATQAAARIEARWNIAFPVQTMFEQPGLRDCAATIRRLLQTAGTRSVPALTVLSAVERARPQPLSHAQRRLWFLWRLDPTNAAYYLSGTFRFSGSLDSRALRSSFDALVARHESLRTVFVAGDDREVRQVVKPPVPVAMTLLDLRGAPESYLARELQNIQQPPFDLAVGPLLRVAVIRLADTQFVLALVVHHIVADGWSMQIMLDELAAQYVARVQGKASPNIALPLQYIDYAAWQRHWLNAGERDRQLAWWREQLGDEHPVLELPTDHPRRTATSYTAARHTWLLPKDLTRDLRVRAQGAGHTLFTLLLAAFYGLLLRYTGQSDIRVGVPVANRTRAEIDPVIGFFVNLVVLRNRIDSRMTLAAVVQQTARVVQGAQAHQDLPFEQLVEALQPGRDLGHSPLFRVLMNHQRVDHRALQALPGLRLEDSSLGKLAAQFELALDTIERADDEIEIRLTYAGELFDADTISGFGKHYQRMLTAVARAPGQRVGAVELLAVEERTRLLSWGRPLESESSATTLHGLFEEQARQRPDAIALVVGTESVRYGELNRRANCLAHRLIALGVAPEVKVGLAMERGVDLLVAVLAVLKAGGAYVPLDPQYPLERLAYMVDDSGVALLLTEAHLKTRLPERPGLPVLSIDSGTNPTPPEHDPAVTMHAGNLAYVIYTSGSTGRPKGAQLCHYNVTRLLASTARWFEFGSQDTWTLFHSPAFDFSVWEIFGALCYGGKLIVVPFAVSRSPEDFLRLLQEQRVTVLNQTPTAFRQLARLPSLPGAGGLALRTVIFGGEALDPEDLRSWLDRFGDEQPRLINMYGITETTVHVTYRPITRNDLGRHVSPVGTAIADLGLHILDEDLNPVPVGVPGELHVTGDGLSRGYLNCPGLSAERFIANPFDPHGARLYRTGDRARWRPDGQLDYLGRIDHQVKIRGFRVELGEIEARLRERPEIRDAVVLVQESAGDACLTGYVVPDMERLATVDRESGVPRDRLVEQWASVFDGAYASGAQDAGAAREPDFRGWNSSYTERPIPLAEMNEWLDHTVARIRALEPQRTLEIGCGVGLLVRALAPGSEAYRATDFSARAVQDFRAWAAAQPTLSHVEVLQREAVDFSGLSAGEFDTVVLNSVAQYFPDVDYLVQVLQGAARIAGPRGRIFVGDLRHLAHLPLFHASVQFARAPAGLTVRQLKRQIHRAVTREPELVLDPAFFHALAPHLPVSSVRVMLKRGSHDNELTRYRYDVVLGGPATPRPDPESFEWTGSDALPRLTAYLSGRRPPALRLSAVPNLRFARDRATWHLIHSSDARDLVSSVRSRLEDLELTGADPEAFWRLGDELGYDVRIGWTNAAAEGAFEVDLVDRASSSLLAAASPPPRPRPQQWQVFASQPRRALLLQQLGGRLRTYLLQHLPDYMVPAQFAVLESLPLTPSGKLDRQALPEPERATAAHYEPPLGPVEGVLAALWAEVLGVERVGRTDNFFAIGGHSLVAIEIAALVTQRYGFDLPIRAFFEHHTLRELAATLDPRAFGDVRTKQQRVSQMAHLLDESGAYE